MNFKKTLAIGLAALLLAGCSGSGSPASSAAPAGSSAGSEQEPAAEPSADLSAQYQNLNFRLALSYAIDRQQIADLVLKDGSIAAEGFIPKDFAYGPDGKDYRETVGNLLSYDVDKAKECLEKAKEELGTDSFTVSLLYETDSEAPGKVCAAIQQMWQDNLGITVNLVSKTKKERLDLMNNLTYEIGLTRWGPDYADPQTYLDLFKSDQSGYNNYYFNDDYDALLNKAENGEDAADPEKRWQDLIDAEKLIIDDMGIIPVFQNGSAMLINPDVTGIEFHNAGVDSYRQITVANDTNTVNIAINADLNTMDHHVATDGGSFVMQNLCIGGLAALDENGQPIPDLAESWEISDDGTVYTFHIRDAKWSNGTPLTANDFVFGWRRLNDPELQSEYAFILETIGVKNAKATHDGEMAMEELGVEAVDDKTFVVTLDRPCGFALGLMAFPSFFPLNEEFFNEHKDTYAQSLDDLLFCGPYVFSNWEENHEYTFTKNPDYWNAAEFEQYADEIIFTFVSEAQSAALSYQQGNTDVVTLTGDLVDQYKADPGFTQRLQGYAWRLNVNQTVKE